jgi:hypothetical protein
MAATVGIMRLTTRSLFVPKILVNALLIKEFLWAPSTIWADSLFYAMGHIVARADGRRKEAVRSGEPDGPGEAKRSRKPFSWCCE